MLENILEKIPYEKIWVVPQWQRWLAIAGTVLLFFVIYYFMSYESAVEKIEQLIGKKEQLSTDYKRYVKYTKRMPQLEKDIVGLNKELKKARMQLPNEKEIPELLTLISNIGTDEGLEFLLFKPSPEQPVDFYAEVPVEMVVQGDFHNLAIFFDKVRKLPRIVNITDVKVKIKSIKGTVILETSCKATTYKYLEEKALLEVKTKKGKI